MSLLLFVVPFRVFHCKLPDTVCFGKNRRYGINFLDDAMNKMYRRKRSIQHDLLTD